MKKSWTSWRRGHSQAQGYTVPFAVSYFKTILWLFHVDSDLGGIFWHVLFTHNSWLPVVRVPAFSRCSGSDSASLWLLWNPVSPHCVCWVSLSWTLPHDALLFPHASTDILVHINVHAQEQFGFLTYFLRYHRLKALYPSQVCAQFLTAIPFFILKPVV